MSFAFLAVAASVICRYLNEQSRLMYIRFAEGHLRSAVMVISDLPKVSLYMESTLDERVPTRAHVTQVEGRRYYIITEHGGLGVGTEHNTRPYLHRAALSIHNWCIGFCDIYSIFSTAPNAFRFNRNAEVS